MRTIEREIVSAIITASDGKICFGKKHSNKGGVYNDCWHLPGGGVDDGEDLLTALKREILEETGIDISDCQIKLVDDEAQGESDKVLADGEKVHCKMHFNVFEVKIDQKAAKIVIELKDDLESIIWADTKKISEIKLTPPSQDLFTKLGLINKM